MPFFACAQRSGGSQDSLLCREHRGSIPVAHGSHSQSDVREGAAPFVLKDAAYDVSGRWFSLLFKPFTPKQPGALPFRKAPRLLHWRRALDCGGSTPLSRSTPQLPRKPQAPTNDANNNTTSFIYDAFGRVTQTNFPSGYVETYNYDAVGNLTSKTRKVKKPHP